MRQDDELARSCTNLLTNHKTDALLLGSLFALCDGMMRTGLVDQPVVRDTMTCLLRECIKSKADDLGIPHEHLRAAHRGLVTTSETLAYIAALPE